MIKFIMLQNIVIDNDTNTIESACLNMYVRVRHVHYKIIIIIIIIIIIV